MLQEIIKKNLTTILAVAAATLFLRLLTHRRRGIPPGPWLTLPIIGNLLQVSRDPIRSFRKMRKKYGDVFSVYFANRLVIAVNGFEMMREAFVRNGEFFSDRPNVFIIDLITNHKGIIGSSGEVWKEQRKLTLMTLRHLGMGKNLLEGSIQTEATALVEELAKTKGQPIDVNELISTSVSNILSSIVFGKRYEFDDPNFIKFLKVVEKTLGTSPVLTFFPYLRFLPGDLFGFKRMKHDVDMVLTELVDVSIDQHLADYDENNINDFISAYLKEMKLKQSQGETKTSVDRSNLRMTIWNLFIAGTETTATTIRWLLLYFLHFPEVQERCFAEIRDHVGCDREICIKDKTELPYLEATILETLRFADIAPISGMHCVSQETMLNGYRIPTDAIILPVLDSVLSDPQVWGDPENFRPDRFLDENAHLTKPEEHIPFLFGPRNCVGESLARMELFLFVATMVQKFEFLRLKGKALPELESVAGFRQFPNDYMLRAVLRE
ncbi:cytochrome P450 2B4-like [Gigantopelta aegis]|uniref:cytochrome P450 2B4-like n=1 Tax=Gigantopelta aegis TaxID=1735272 RepID=UPI001B88ACD8|nr:cytochrome P450 2B4-like [Gigantopelta aegis]